MMVNFIVYDSITGKIKRTGSCRAYMVGAQAGDGEVAIESDATDLDFRVDPRTRIVVPAPEIRAAYEAAGRARRAAARAKLQSIIARLQAIIRNPTTPPSVRTLAEIELERL